MQNEQILNRKMTEEIEKIIDKNYGSEFSLRDYGVILNNIEKKVKIFSKEILDLNLSKLKVNSIGIYFGKLKANDKIHLTIEGSQLVGRDAKKNVSTISEENAFPFMSGKDVFPESCIECEDHNFVIIKCGDDIMGTGLMQEGKIKNLLPKSRKFYI